MQSSNLMNEIEEIVFVFTLKCNHATSQCLPGVSDWKPLMQTQCWVSGKRVVHMKKFPLDGDNEGKEASLFVVPFSVKGEKNAHCSKY